LSRDILFDRRHPTTSRRERFRSVSRFLVLYFLLGFLSAGCAHPYLGSWQKDGQFTVCCNKWCTDQDWSLQNEKYCEGEAEILGGFSNKVVGSRPVITPTYNSSGQYVGNSTSYATDTSKENCKNMVCKGRLRIENIK